ncbi:hypothetical protein CLAIMM_05228 [Cladophialophora immunda]|nr:hypothetical protein CLAIMM_05228 [Cladophialophora immunda]
MQDGLRIFTPVGMLGYSFSESTFWDTLKRGVDAVILDSGSTDNGPSKLALGKPTVAQSSYERDLAILVAGIHHYKKPLLIGSAGGDGSNTGVDLLVNIIKDIIKREGYRPMKVLRIYSQIDKDIVRSKLKAGLMQPCGEAVPELKVEDIDAATKIVAQMGMEPWLEAMNQHPDFDIIVGGRTYDPAPYAAFCAWKGLTDMGTIYHMGKIMECGALCATPKNKSALAIVRDKDFVVTPLDPSSICTEASVAAHTLYEKTRPDILLGPGGALLLETAKYEQLPDGRSVRVWGATFMPEQQYTVKLEAGKLVGFYSMCFGGFRDPILISQLDDFLARGKQLVAQHAKYPHELEYRVYGRDAIMGPLEKRTDTPHEVGVVAHALAGTQEEATNVVHIARVHMMHSSYPHQRATAGNFAMPFAPLDIPLGQVSEFCMYHLMPINDPLEHFPVYAQTVEGSNTAPALQLPATANGHIMEKPTTNGHTPVEQHCEPKTGSVLNKEPPPGHTFLADLATYVRSKNAGPYELTFDVIFSDAKTKDRVKATGVLTRATVARLYGIKEDDVIASLWWDQALAFKATIKRPRVGGGFWERDSHGSQQHIPLMELPVPVSLDSYQG